MLNGQKIILVSTVDNDNRSIEDLKIRIWDWHVQISNLLQNSTCLIGRQTYDIMQWKGSNSWVLTRNLKWSKSKIGTIHDLDDLHLYCEGPIYVLGGNSVHQQIKDYVDEIHLYVLNNRRGTQKWLDIDMNEWKPIDYKTRISWSYVHLERSNPIDE